MNNQELIKKIEEKTDELKELRKIASARADLDSIRQRAILERAKRQEKCDAWNDEMLALKRREVDSLERIADSLDKITTIRKCPVSLSP